MKKYRVKTYVYLGFLTSQDQYDIRVESGKELEFDGHTIWLVDGDERKESITCSWAIDNWLESGQIEEN